MPHAGLQGPNRDPRAPRGDGVHPPADHEQGFSHADRPGRPRGQTRLRRAPPFAAALRRGRSRLVPHPRARDAEEAGGLDRRREGGRLRDRGPAARPALRRDQALAAARDRGRVRVRACPGTRLRPDRPGRDRKRWWPRLRAEPAPDSRRQSAARGNPEPERPHGRQPCREQRARDDLPD